MAVQIEGDQAAVLKLLAVDFEHTEQGATYDLGRGAVDSQLNDAGKT